MAFKIQQGANSVALAIPVRDRSGSLKARANAHRIAAAYLDRVASRGVWSSAERLTAVYVNLAGSGYEVRVELCIESDRTVVAKMLGEAADAGRS